MAVIDCLPFLLERVMLGCSALMEMVGTTTRAWPSGTLAKLRDELDPEVWTGSSGSSPWEPAVSDPPALRLAPVAEWMEALDARTDGPACDSPRPVRVASSIPIQRCAVWVWFNWLTVSALLPKCFPLAPVGDTHLLAAYATDAQVLLGSLGRHWAIDRDKAFLLCQLYCKCLPVAYATRPEVPAKLTSCRACPHSGTTCGFSPGSL